MVDWCPDVFWLVNGWKWRMLWFLDSTNKLMGKVQGDGTGKYGAMSIGHLIDTNV